MSSAHGHLGSPAAVTAGFRPAQWACVIFAALAAVTAAGITARTTLLGMLERESSHGHDLKRDYDANGQPGLVAQQDGVTMAVDAPTGTDHAPWTARGRG